MDGETGPFGELCRGLANQTQGDIRSQVAHGEKNLGKKRGNDKAAAGRMRVESPDSDAFKARDFDFDVQEGLVLITGEDLVEDRKFAEVGGAGLADFDAVNFRVVTDDGAAIGGKADVEFESVAAVGKSEVEGGEGVFWNGASGTSTAVAEQEREH